MDQPAAGSGGGRHIAEDRLLALLEASPDAMLIAGTDGTIHYVNSLAERLFGYDSRHLEGRQVEVLIPERFRSVHLRHRTEFLEHPRTRAMGEGRGELVGRRADGHEFPVTISLNPLRAGGEMLVVATIRDATEQRRAIADLEGQVSARTRELERKIAELEAAERTLEQSRARLAAVLDSLREGVIVSDLDGHVLEMNPAALALHGFASPDEARRRLPEFAERFELHRLDGERLPLFEWPLARALRGEAFTDFEVEVRRKDDGTEAILSYSGTPVKDGGGKAVLGVLTIRDISERKRAEQALRESEAQLRATFEQAAVGIAHISLPERRFLRANEAACRIVGYREEELVRLTVADITHPEDRDVGTAEYAKLMDGELPSLTVEKRYVRKDGRPVWVRATVSAVREGAASPRFGISVIIDITAAKAADQARQDAERRLELAVSIAELGFWELDVGDGRFYLSPQSKKLLGYEDDQLPNRREEWQTRLHPEDRERVLEHLARFTQRPESEYRIEYRLQHRDGGYRWIASRAMAVVDGDGRLAKLIGTHLDITDRKLSEQRIREAALHDPLTGLPNRALVFEYGNHLLAAAQRSHGTGALLFIDLDRFKPVNDLYGHEVGDRLLQEVARRLTDCTRQEDLVGRLGGDEFIIVLPHLDFDRRRAATVAQHVIDRIGEPFRIDGLELSVSPSIGISYYLEHGKDVDELIHAADLAMYEAKQMGRANYQFYAPHLDRRAEAAISLEAKVKDALLHGGLMLHYQPVIDLRSGRLTGAEALVRLVGDECAGIGPQRFVPVAESAGLVGALGEWVAAEACRQHEEWRRQGLPLVSIAINVSALQFRQRDFADRLRDIIAASGMDPACLQVEVTEGTLMESIADAVAILGHLKSVGVKVALDNFGTGYSNLSNLGNLPLDKLKVDQSFVQRLEADQSSQAITQAILALGRALKLEIVGEGIESEATLDYLRSNGCDQAQGFLFSRPLPAGEFAEWYRRHLH